ncbi:MAG: hypothetical protein LBE12_13790 [Planctomycetaceae bacterium]|jgi:hypothetical protein|nr:hypothetical protein [Planctomycetaceae bacterium]
MTLSYVSIIIKDNKVKYIKKIIIILMGIFMSMLSIVMCMIIPIPVHEWWILCLQMGGIIVFFSVLVNVFFQMMILNDIQISDKNIVFKNFFNQPMVIYWNEELSCQYFYIPFLGKLASIYSFNKSHFTPVVKLKLMGNFSFYSLVLPPKTFVENINELESFINNIHNEGKLLESLKVMYCCDCLCLSERFDKD